MKNAVKNLSGDHLCLWFLTISVIILIFGLALLVFWWGRLPPQVPLFYSRPWGEDQLAQKPQIIFLPGMAFSIFLLNIFSSARLLPKEPILARILTGSGCVLTFILILALFQIINLVG